VPPSDPVGRCTSAPGFPGAGRPTRSSAGRGPLLAPAADGRQTPAGDL